MPPSHDEEDPFAMPGSDTLDAGTTRAGENLRQERIQRRDSLADVSREVGLPMWVVEGLETGALSLDDAQNKAYLRIYARELGLDAESLLRDLDHDPDSREPLTSLGPHSPLEEDGGGPTALPLPSARLLMGLALAAAVGALLGVLVWSGPPGVEVTAPTPSAPEEPTVGEEPTVPEEPTTDEGPTTDEDLGPDADAPAVRPPEQTRVQVLHNGDEAAADEVTATLEALGYSEIAVDTTLSEQERTTVYYVEGWEGEAELLRTHDERFAEVEANEDYTADADLHIVVGQDWTSGE